MGIYEADPQDREIVAGCAEVLEQVLTAVEEGKSSVQIQEIDFDRKNGNQSVNDYGYL